MQSLNEQMFKNGGPAYMTFGTDDKSQRLLACGNVLHADDKEDMIVYIFSPLWPMSSTIEILADQLIFRKVLMEFGVPLSEARLGMLLIPLMLQTRAYQDPVSGFYCLMQVLTAELLFCAFFLSRWLRTGKGRELALSLLCFGLGLLTYEVCFPFLLMICLLIWVRRKNQCCAKRHRCA